MEKPGHDPGPFLDSPCSVGYGDVWWGLDDAASVTATDQERRWTTLSTARALVGYLLERRPGIALILVRRERPHRLTTLKATPVNLVRGPLAVLPTASRLASLVVQQPGRGPDRNVAQIQEAEKMTGR